MLMELWVNIRGVSSHAKAPELSPPTGCQPPGPHPAPKPQRCLSSPHVSDGHPEPPELHIAARPLQKHICGGEKSQNGDKEVAGTFPEEQGHPDTTHPQPLRPVSKKSGCAASPVPRFPHLSAPALRLGTHRARGPGMGLSWKPPALIFFFFFLSLFSFCQGWKKCGGEGQHRRQDVLQRCVSPEPCWSPGISVPIVVVQPWGGCDAFLAPPGCAPKCELGRAGKATAAGA